MTAETIAVNNNTVKKEIEIDGTHAATLIVLDGENGEKESFWIDIDTSNGEPKITFFDQNRNQLKTTKNSVVDGQDRYSFVVNDSYHVELNYDREKNVANIVAHRLTGVNFS